MALQISEDEYMGSVVRLRRIVYFHYCHARLCGFCNGFLCLIYMETLYAFGVPMLRMALETSNLVAHVPLQQCYTKFLSAYNIRNNTMQNGKQANINKYVYFLKEQLNYYSSATYIYTFSELFKYLLK